MDNVVNKISRNRVYYVNDAASMNDLRNTAETLFGLQNKYFEMAYQYIVIGNNGDRYETLSFMVNWDETDAAVSLDFSEGDATPVIVVEIKTIPVTTRILTKRLVERMSSLSDNGVYTLEDIERKLQTVFGKTKQVEYLYGDKVLDEKHLLGILNIKDLPKFPTHPLLRYSVSTSDSKLHFNKDGLDKITIQLSKAEYLVNPKLPALDHSWVNIETLREYPKVKSLDAIFE